ncbi:unnamed protein product [Danaus chrysippus]|uniref:(African queen) hypothetical protein n=1 Tax=Danaus chrysippus TaxID=151541 RepID=A0A8J2QMD6_9NEOP|nr:unnamed protein product [Danaus chrysippus]
MPPRALHRTALHRPHSHWPSLAVTGRHGSPLAGAGAGRRSCVGAARVAWRVSTVSERGALSAGLGRRLRARPSRPPPSLLFPPLQSLAMDEH